MQTLTIGIIDAAGAQKRILNDSEHTWRIECYGVWWSSKTKPHIELCIPIGKIWSMKLVTKESEED